MNSSNYEFSIIDPITGDSSEFFSHPIYSNYLASQDGLIYSIKRHRLLEGGIDRDGYNRIHIIDDRDKKSKKIRSHRFIYEACNNEITSSDVDIDHINRNRFDNRLVNLRLVSRSVNSRNRCNNIEVNSIPDDSIPIEKYGIHQFNNLYYSPSTDHFYIKYGDFTFRIGENILKIDKYSYQSIRVNDINGNTVNIYKNKLKKSLR